jgi:DNA end-binding protein Ku
MSARAISSGNISFGLVSIPVKLYSTAQPGSGISFNLLHRKCNSRLKQQYICPTDNEIVPRDEMVKGYEFSKDQYVIFTEEELKAIEEQSTKAIEITEFVPAEKVDPIYFEGSYYLGPEKGGERAYRLLGEAMRQAGQVAVARYSARGRQSLVMVRPMGIGLVMEQLRYADEVRPQSEVPIPEAELKEAELKLAMQFVSQLANDEFHPENYQDEFRNKLLEMIRQKSEGQAVTMAAPEAPRAQIIDLMEALKASLAQPAKPAASKSAPAAGEPRKPPKRAPRAAGEAQKKAKSSKA